MHLNHRCSFCHIASVNEEDHNGHHTGEHVVPRNHKVGVQGTHYSQRKQISQHSVSRQPVGEGIPLA